MSEFEQEIETLNKGCGNWDDNTLVECERECNKGHLCKLCQAKLETAQKLKIAHDNEIAEFKKAFISLEDCNKAITQLKREELEFLEEHQEKLRMGNFDIRNVEERMSKLKQELKDG